MSDLILKQNGTPFGSAAAANMVLSKKYDPKRYVVEECEGGFGIAFKEYDEEEEVFKEYDSESSDATHKIVVFAAGGPGSLKKIPITVNGACLRYARDVEVCVPVGHLKAIDNAIEIRHRNIEEDFDPEEDEEYRVIQRFPYRVIRDSSLQEFNAMMSAAKKRRKTVKRG